MVVKNPLPVVISLSKAKYFYGLLGLSLIALLGFLLLFRPYLSEGRELPAILLGAGIIGLICFGLALSTVVIRLMDKRPGLYIDARKLVDNSSRRAAGEIPWDDIEDISKGMVARHYVVLVHLKDPRKIIEAQTSAIKRAQMEYHLKAAGTPVCISPGGLETFFNHLWEEMAQAFEKVKGHPPSGK